MQETIRTFDGEQDNAAYPHGPGGMPGGAPIGGRDGGGYAQAPMGMAPMGMGMGGGGGAGGMGMGGMGMGRPAGGGPGGPPLRPRDRRLPTSRWASPRATRRKEAKHPERGWEWEWGWGWGWIRG